MEKKDFSHVSPDDRTVVGHHWMDFSRIDPLTRGRENVSRGEISQTTETDDSPESDGKGHDALDQQRADPGQSLSCNRARTIVARQCVVWRQ
jgi:hypothetical protein